MKYERKYYTENIQLIDELGDTLEDSPGLSEETLKKIITKATQIEEAQAKEIPDKDKILEFHRVANQAILIAEDLCLDITAETFAKYGRIEMCSNSILFSAAFSNESKNKFIALVKNADDISISQRDGLVYVTMTYLFC